MEKDIRVEASKQYLKYFRIWFIVIGVLAVITGAFWISNLLEEKVVRRNDQAPVERVYDLADVLTSAEEEKLRVYIASAEEQIKADIVLVTMNKVMEGAGSAYNGSWETNMRNTADDFYDQNGYGYDKPQGDGVLLLDNWYSGQAGSWLSTCGQMIDKFYMSDIDRVLDQVYYGIEYGSGAYEGYRNALEEIVEITGGESVASDDSYWGGAFLISTVAALIYIFTKLRNKEGEKTVVSGTYVEGRPVTNINQDQFIRRVVTRRTIPRQSTSSGGRSMSSSSRSSGSHRSSGGVSHGGGGRRR